MGFWRTNGSRVGRERGHKGGGGCKALLSTIEYKWFRLLMLCGQLVDGSGFCWLPCRPSEPRGRGRHCRMPSEIIRLSHDMPRRPDGIRGCQLQVHWDIASILTFIFSVEAYQSRCDNGEEYNIDVPGPSNCQFQFPIPLLALYDLIDMCFCCALCSLADKSRKRRPD